MNHYIIPVTCSVCGGEATASPMDAAREWFGGFLSHSDPRICEEVLREKKRQEKRKKEMASEYKDESGI